MVSFLSIAFKKSIIFPGKLTLSSKVAYEVQDSLTRFCPNLTKILNFRKKNNFRASSDATNFDHFRWSWSFNLAGLNYGILRIFELSV